MSLRDRFIKYSPDIHTFDLVENKLSTRSDLHAFLLLDKICPLPGGGTIISSASHDQIWLDIDPEMLEVRATDEQIHELVRCGVRYTSNDGFAIFV